MTNAQTSLERQDYHTELDQDELLWQAKINELFEQIISWLAPLSGLIECKIIPILLDNYEEFLEDNNLPVLPPRTKHVLRIVFPSGKYAELLPSGPHVVGDDYTEYFAEVTLRMRNRKLILVMIRGDSDWECAEYFGLHKPLIFCNFNQQVLRAFLL